MKMKKISKIVLTLSLCFVVTAAFASCAPKLNSIAVTPATATIAEGATQQFTATGSNSDGSTSDITNQVNWSSSNEAVATISGGGLATGVSAGIVTITATQASGSVLGSATLTVTGVTSYPVGTNPNNIAIDASGNAWITNSGSSNVTVLNSSGAYLNGTLSNSTFAVGTSPAGIAIDSLGNVWVVNNGSNNVTVLNSSGAYLNGTFANSTFPVGSGPRGIAIDASGNVWVANYGSNNVTVLNSSGAYLYGTFLNSTFPVGPEPYGIAIDSSGNVWVTNSGNTTTVNTTTPGNTVTVLNSSGAYLYVTIAKSTFAVGNGPRGIVIDASGNVWVTNFSNTTTGNTTTPGNTVTELSPSSGEVIGTITVGSNPAGIAIDNSGNVWVTNFGNSTTPGNTVTELSPSSREVIGTITVGSNPAGIAIDASGNVWVANYGSNTVTVWAGGAKEFFPYQGPVWP
jgi:DNA-binding beta-propeller fold protein YncE